MTFGAGSVLQIMADRKTETRRVLVPQPKVPSHYLQRMLSDPFLWREVGPDYPDADDDDRRPYYGIPGEEVYVKEALVCGADRTWLYASDQTPVQVAPEDEGRAVSWAFHRDHPTCPSRFMPRFAARTILRLSLVDLQPLQDIHPTQVWAEGFSDREEFEAGWDRLNAARGYPFSSNPWVWRYQFWRRP